MAPGTIVKAKKHISLFSKYVGNMQIHFPSGKNARQCE
jgi:hypothetical protein